MFAFMGSLRVRARSILRTCGVVATACALVACVPKTLPNPGLTGGGSIGPAPLTKPKASGEIIGKGSVRIALLVPEGAANPAIASLGTELKNAARMAMADYRNPDIEILVKPTQGTAQGASTAAQVAMTEGAELVIGPLFAHSVKSVSAVTRANNRSIVAFSTDETVASRGVYLLSFLPRSDAERALTYAAASGRKSFTALLPDNAYGNIMEAAFRETVANVGGRIIGIERYKQGANGRIDIASAQAASLTIAGLVGGSAPKADVLFMPDNLANVATLSQFMKPTGLDTNRVMVLGSSQWDDARVKLVPLLQGAYYPAASHGSGGRGFQGFAARYQAAFGKAPRRTASLAYDAVILAAAQVVTSGSKRYTPEALTVPGGFSGIDGLFRFKANGLNDRGLAMYRVGPTGGTQAAPAPTSFSR